MGYLGVRLTAIPAQVTVEDMNEYVRIPLTPEAARLVDEQAGPKAPGRSGGGRTGFVTRLLYAHLGLTPPDYHGLEERGPREERLSGAAIRAARGRAGLSQRELGEKIGVSVSGVSRLESRGVKEQTVEDRVRAALAGFLEG